MLWCAAVAATCAAVAAGCGEDDGGGSAGSEDSARLVVSAAASMTEPLEECAPTFDAAESTDVRMSLAGSDVLAAQIRRGAKVDVYAAANTRLPEALHADGLLDEPLEFATNRFVLAVPKDSSIDSVDDLTQEGTKVVVGSEAVPIGAYAREMLAKLPRAQQKAILDNVRSNEPDVKGIVGKLTQGAADAGFTYATDVKATGGALRAIGLPSRLEPDVTYGAGVVTGAQEPELGRRFVDSLRKGECAEALDEAGFGPAP